MPQDSKATATSAPLAGKTAWVTGGSRGIGAAIVANLRADGAAVGVLDLREPGPGAADAFVACDLAAPDGADLAAGQLSEAFGDADILVNNAGVVVGGLVDELAPEEWARVLQVNLTSPFRLIARVVPTMRARGWGRIVSVSSGNAFRVQPGRVAYTSSKAGIVALTKVVAMEVAAYGVTANAVAPGLVDTEMSRTALGNREALEEMARDSRLANPMGRLLAPADIAGAVRYLVSPDARGVTGQTIHVNAGAYMP